MHIIGGSQSCIFGLPQILGMLPTQGENDNSDQYISQ